MSVSIFAVDSDDNALGNRRELPQDVLFRRLCELRDGGWAFEPGREDRLAGLLVNELGRAGLLPKCERTWLTGGLGRDGTYNRAMHTCEDYLGHPGRCVCRKDGCRSWRPRRESGKP